MTERLPAGDAHAESAQATGGATRLHDLTRAGLAAAAVRVVLTADTGDLQRPDTLAAVRQGVLDEAVVDSSVSSVMRMPV